MGCGWPQEWLDQNENMFNATGCPTSHRIGWNLSANTCVKTARYTNGSVIQGWTFTGFLAPEPSSMPCHSIFFSNLETQAVSSALLLICMLNYVCLVWNACVKQSGHNFGVFGEPQSHVEGDARFGNKLHHGFRRGKNSGIRGVPTRSIKQIVKLQAS